MEWSWRVEHDLELLDMSLRDPTSDAIIWRCGDRQFEHQDCLELVVRDRLVARDELRPTQVARHFERARRTTPVDWSGRVSQLDQRSPLEEAAVQFAWDDEDEVHRARFTDEEALEEQLDLRQLLDGRPRRRGEHWWLEEEAVWRLLRPGGRLPLEVEGDARPGAHDNAVLGWLLSTTLLARGGDVWGRAHYAGVIRHEGRAFARIRLRIELEFEEDVRDRLAELVAEHELGRSWADVAEAIRVEQHVVLEGPLYWDLEARRADSLELTGRSDVQLELDFDQESFGLPSASRRLSAEFRGNLRVAVESGC